MSNEDLIEIQSNNSCLEKEEKTEQEQQKTVLTIKIMNEALNHLQHFISIQKSTIQIQSGIHRFTEQSTKILLVIDFCTKRKENLENNFL